MSKLFAGFLVIASMLALSGFGTLGLVLVTHITREATVAPLLVSLASWLGC